MIQLGRFAEGRVDSESDAHGDVEEKVGLHAFPSLWTCLEGRIRGIVEDEVKRVDEVEGWRVEGVAGMS